MTVHSQSAGAVHQFVPMLHIGDAVGRHTVAVQAELRKRGVASEVFVELDDPETVELTIPASRYPERAAPGDVLVYQMATASDLAPWLVARPQRLVVNYHNVTPPELFAPWDNALALHQVLARQQLSDLARRAALGVAVSAYNRADLEAAGFRSTAVVPPVVALPADGFAEESHGVRAWGARWLCVGRLAPNKAIEDAIAALFWYRAAHDGDATLRVVGKPAIGAYVDALTRWVGDLGLEGAVRFEGRVTDEGLQAAYRHADVLVVTSEHEGFCLPVVEAMAHGLPVVAFRQGALPEVLGPAGVLLDRKDPRTVADAVLRIQTDPDRRAAVVAAGHKRLPELELPTAGSRLVDLLLEVRDGGAVRR